MLWQVYSFLELQIVLDDKTLHDGLGVKSSSKTSLKTQLLAVARKMNPCAVPQETKVPFERGHRRSARVGAKSPFEKKNTAEKSLPLYEHVLYVSTSISPKLKTFQKDFIFPQACHFIEDLF